MMRRVLVSAVLSAAAAAAASVAPARAAVGGPELFPPRTCAAGSLERRGSARVAYAAVVRGHARVYRRRGLGPVATFGPLNPNGVPTVFGIVGAVVDAACKPTWYRVQVPVRPNGASGFVRARAVDVARVHTRVVVDVSARRLVLYRDGRAVLTAAVAVGSPGTPTPTGRFYVNQRLIPADRSGPFGPGALGISAYSDVLTGWAQGGPIAIHGTNQPWSIGHAVSNGCIRLANPLAKRIFDAALAGTPVVIRA
jgi:lipoprotein-anchoring transpeptidase ErfK/SrfK